MKFIEAINYNNEPQLVNLNLVTQVKKNKYGDTVFYFIDGTILKSALPYDELLLTASCNLWTIKHPQSRENTINIYTDSDNRR